MTLAKTINRPPLGLFLGAFALYVFSCAPHVAPYRDAGEMASLLATLGVAHPPGYPLYTLLGHWALWIPLGNAVFRANIFSALCGAVAVAVFYRVLRRWTGTAAAVVGAGLFAVSNPFWELASVSEMYTLGLLWLCLLMDAAFVEKDPVLWAFLMGCGLGVRMDLMLLIPIFLGWFWRRRQLTRLIPMAIFFGLGVSIFLYMPIRSLQDPAIDWGNPDSLQALFNSASRRSYSGTLDLLSLSYAKGGNFPANAKLYGLHLVRSFGWGGLILMLAGVYFFEMAERAAGLAFGGIFLMAGPLFLYLANLPPNPHAIAIVEAAYPVPDLMAAAFAAFGVDGFLRLLARKSRWFSFGALGLAAAAIALNASSGYARATKRNNFFLHDYAETVLRSLPRNAVAAFHKDVQLFTLWETQLVERRRLDVSLVATGLSGSDWYWDMMRRWGAAPAPDVSLKDTAGWGQMKRAAGARPFVAGFETEVPPESKLTTQPHGLVVTLGEPPNTELSAELLNDLGMYRGQCHYGETPDFFSSDLAGDISRAYERQGFDFLTKNDRASADWCWKRAESLDPTFPRPASDRAYVCFTSGDFKGAYDAYQSAIKKYRAMLLLADAYKSLPDAVAPMKAELASVYTNTGAAEERLGRKEAARDYYEASFTLVPNADAHYNMAVTYWNMDWEKVVSHLASALDLNPNYDAARRTIGAALQHRDEQRRQQK